MQTHSILKQTNELRIILELIDNNKTIIQTKIEKINNVLNFYNKYYTYINELKQKKNVKENFKNILEYIDILTTNDLEYINMKENINEFIIILEDIKDSYFNEELFSNYIDKYNHFLLDDEYDKFVNMIEFIYLYIHIYEYILNIFKEITNTINYYLLLILDSEEIIYNIFHKSLNNGNNYKKEDIDLKFRRIYNQQHNNLNILKNVSDKYEYIKNINKKYSQYYLLCCGLRYKLEGHKYLMKNILPVSESIRSDESTNCTSNDESSFIKSDSDSKFNEYSKLSTNDKNSSGTIYVYELSNNQEKNINYKNQILSNELEDSYKSSKASTRSVKINDNILVCH